MRCAKRISALFPVLLLLAGCSSTPPDVHESRFIMGTLVQFTISGSDRDKALGAIRAAADEMQRIDDTFTIYGTHANTVKTFNASKPGEIVKLAPEVDKLLLTSLDVWRQSGGAFDPAIGSLSLLWGFSLPVPPKAPPSAGDIGKDLAGSHPDMLVRREAGWKRLNAETMLDFGGIAKGYAIDRGIAVLRAHGIANAILDAGGDLRVIGDHHGKPWRIGLRHPRRKDETLGWFEASGDVSIVTSGDYERFYLYHGKRYQHILDPKTGMPAALSQSVTVVADNATKADGWSTALFVLGAKGLPLADARGMQAVLVDAEGVVHTTKRVILPFHPTPQPKPG
jgi:FAD:protein FMN transferase